MAEPFPTRGNLESRTRDCMRQIYLLLAQGKSKASVERFEDATGLKPCMDANGLKDELAHRYAFLNRLLLSHRAEEYPINAFEQL